MDFKLNEYHRNIKDEDLLNDLINVAKLLNKGSVTQKEYNEYGNYNCSTLIRKFKTWNNALKVAKLEINFVSKYSDYQLFENLENVWISLGKQPTRRDMDKIISKISSGPYTDRFKGWYNALEQFIKFVDNNGINFKEKDKSPINYIDEHITKRDINLRLRFKVMKRDNFKCCICGASPSKDPNVELHIDHIIPWSKGGETLENNLQTLCSKCNFGKSDL